jgi:hypothetical protein
MDAKVFARIATALVSATDAAKVRAKEYGIDPQFREIVRHARELHFLMVEQLLFNEALSTEYYHGLLESTGNSIKELEALSEMPDGKMQ